MTTVYRITKKKRIATAFEGIGAQTSPGRWNSLGNRVVYTAATRSLAMLEILVHCETEDLLREHFIVIPADIPDKCITAPTSLPVDWQTDPPPASTRNLGDLWIASSKSLALAIPSTIVPAELNYLLNPLHPDFSQIAFGEPEPLAFDHRFSQRTTTGPQSPSARTKKAPQSK